MSCRALLASYCLSLTANKAGRQEWEDAYANGLELLGFPTRRERSRSEELPELRIPLLAEAATQFQAQAFNELLPASGPVRTAVYGSETSEKEQQAIA